MFVEKWMTRDVVTLPPNATISQAAIEMGRRRFRHIPIASSSSRGKILVGIVSKYDIARAFPDDFNPFSLAVTDGTVPKPVSTIMCSKVVTVSPDCSIEDAAELLRKHHINALPVVRENRLAGMITESDIFAALLEITGSNSGGIKLVADCDTAMNPTSLIAKLCEQDSLPIRSFACFFDTASNGKIHLLLRLARRPSSGFMQEIHRLGFRVLSVG